jgi:O-antigen/teichoic acid export membrane protein
VIQILAIAGVSTALQISCWSVFMATQQFRCLVYLNLFHLAVMVPTMFVFVPPHGAVGAALAHLAACIASLPVAFTMVRAVIGLPIARLVGAIWRPALAAVAMYLTMEAVRPGALPAGSAPLALLGGLVGAIAVGAAAYCTAVALLWLASGRPTSAELEAGDYLRRLAGKLTRR